MSQWPAGYYFTDIAPLQAQTLRSGQLSFALYGDPYHFGSNVTCFAVTFPNNALPPRVKATLGDETPGHGLYRRSSVMPLPLGGGDGTLPPSPENVTFQTGPPGAADVPRSTLMPANGPNWSGARGDSLWQSPVSIVNDITGNQPIPFSNGYPNFSRWSIFSHPINPLQRGNTTTDFDEADAAWATSEGHPGDITWARQERRRRPVLSPTGQTVVAPNATGNLLWTWHHSQDERTMVLVPSKLNIGSNTPHQGGAALARRARW